MKISSNTSFDINILKGALVINPTGAESYIKGVSVDLVNHSIFIVFQVGQSLEWSTLKYWEIQFQGYC